MTDKKIRVSEMPRTSISPVGLVEIEFKRVNDGSSITLEFDPDAFENFLSRAIRNIRAAQSQRRSKNSRSVVHIVKSWKSGPVPGGRAVGLTLVSGDLPTHYAIQTDMIGNLIQELRSAEQSARIQSERTQW